LLALAALAPGAIADAQEDGIKVGDGVLHPFIDLQSRYDTFAALDAAGAPVGDLLWDIRPGLKLNIPSPTLSFDLGGDVDAVLYTLNPGLNRILADGSVAVGINRGGVIGLDLGDQFNRTDNNNIVALPFAILSDYNDASAKLAFRPGGGALAIEPGYDFIYEHFEAIPGAGGLPSCPGGSALCDPANASLMDFINQKLSLNLRWKFLPKTAFLLGGDYLIASYQSPGAGLSANAPLSIFDATVGIAGLLTNRFEIIAKVGYAQTMLNSTDLTTVPGLAAVGDAHTPIGQFELAYAFSETGKIKAGVQRLLQATPTVLAYYTDTRPYVGAHFLLGGKLTLHLDASYDSFSYALDTLGSTAGRTDGSLRLDVGPEYEIAHWIRIAAGYDFTNMASTDPYAYDYNSHPAFGGPYGYDDNEVYLRVTLTY
jgi:hypothetical protein